jgi:hypothetical protein
VNPDQGPVEAYNNLIYHVGTGPAPSGQESDYACIYTNASANPAQSVEVYNNTFYDCGSRGNSNSGGFTTAIKTRFRNNLVLQASGAEPYFSGGSGGCALVSGSNNLWFGAGALPCTANLNADVSVDPKVVGAASGDFHLQPGSPAIGAGTSIPDLLVTLDGTLRKGAYNLGAF